MANTSIAVTSGSGNTIDMRSLTDGDLRQVIVIGSGEEAGNSDIAPVNATYGVSVKPESPTTIGHGRKTVTSAGTALALAATTTCRYVIVTALDTNTDVISIGATGVIASNASNLRTGVPLLPGQGIRIEVRDLASLFVDSVVSGEGVSYAYFV